METLSKIFGSAVRVKLMRLFLFNPDFAYPVSEISDRSKSHKREVKKELSELIKIGFIKKRQIVREISSKTKRKIKVRKVHDRGFILDSTFPYLQALKNLLITVSLHADDSLVKKFSSIGKIKLFVVSGFFIQEWDTRVDLLIVGDDINLNRLEIIMKVIEAEAGKEIAYSAFDTDDFEYRYGIHDKLIRDILDLPHVTLVDKMGIDKK